MNAIRLAINGMLLLGLLSGFAPPALSCSTNPCDKEKLSSDIVETLVNCSGSQCDKIVPDPVDTISSCEGSNCADTKLFPDPIQAISSCESGRCSYDTVLPDPPGREVKGVRAPVRYADCSGDKCDNEEVPKE